MLFRVKILPIQVDAEAESLLQSAGLTVSDLREAPTVIAATSQYSGLCPASSTLMRRPIGLSVT